MAKSTPRAATKAFLARLPWLEASVTILAGLILFFPLANKDLAKLTWALGAILSVGRLSYELRLERELEPVRKLAEVMDLSKETSIDDLRELQRVYLAITEAEFRPVKNHILSECRDSLLRLANEKTSEALSAGEYYGWLLPILDGAPSGSRIRALSVMMDAEWEDTPTERRFHESSVAAATRGVLFDRVFVMSEDQTAEALQVHAIKVQTREEEPGRFRGHLVRREYLKRQDPNLLARLGDGFIAFDDRVALVDILSPEGVARGQVTMNSAEIARLIKLHDQLLLHSEPLSISQASVPAKSTGRA